MRRINPDAPLTSAQKTERHRDARHRITQEWVDDKALEQENKCAICCRPFSKTPHIDHDHSCCPQSKSCDKCRRGLLCWNCNSALGLFRESEEVLTRAIEYLRKYRKEHHASE